MENKLMLNAVIFLIGVQLALHLFLGQAFPVNTLWDFVRNPSAWTQAPLVAKVIGMMALAGVATIIAGFIVGRSELAIMAAFSTILLSYGIPLYNLWQYINGQAIFGDAATLIAMIFVSPIIIVYIMLVIYFWRGRD